MGNSEAGPVGRGHPEGYHLWVNTFPPAWHLSGQRAGSEASKVPGLVS
jgi:hypothetical protein